MNVDYFEIVEVTVTEYVLIEVPIEVRVMQKEA